MNKKQKMTDVCTVFFHLRWKKLQCNNTSLVKLIFWFPTDLFASIFPSLFYSFEFFLHIDIPEVGCWLCVLPPRDGCCDPWPMYGRCGYIERLCPAGAPSPCLSADLTAPPLLLTALSKNIKCFDWVVWLFIVQVICVILLTSTKTIKTFQKLYMHTAQRVSV